MLPSKTKLISSFPIKASKLSISLITGIREVKQSESLWNQFLSHINRQLWIKSDRTTKSVANDCRALLYAEDASR